MSEHIYFIFENVVIVFRKYKNNMQTTHVGLFQIESICLSPEKLKKKETPVSTLDHETNVFY